MRVNRNVLVAALVGAGLTLGVTLLPFVQFAYWGPDVHLVMETAEALIALLVAYLLLGRVRARRLLPDLVLFAAMALFASSTALLSVLPTIARPVEAGEAFLVWAPLAARLLATLGVAVAAFLPARVVPGAAAIARRAAVGTIALSVAIGAAAAGLHERLPVVLDAVVSPIDSARPLVSGHPLVLSRQIVGMLAFFAAAWGFRRRCLRERDALLGWVAVGCVLAGFARLNYFLFPSLYTDWVYTGDLLRMGFWAVLLWGCTQELQGYWQGLARAAVLEERRRIARDLHDGLAQELAFIARQTGGLDDERLRPVSAAAERALDESRRAITLLARSVDEPLDALLARTAEEVAGRVGVRVRFAMDDGVEVEPSEREALLRILREAVTNAARHGGAAVVDVRLARGPGGVELAVRDDGRGFDPASPPGDGFGLVSMRERAESLGGTLRIRSAPGAGTEVEVVLP